jgi:hypothetical protein
VPGPPPNPPGQRRRRNATTAPVTLPASRSRSKVPPLPLKRATAATKAWWRTIWTSPMATVWLEADVPGLVRLAELVELGHREGATPLAAMSEIRALEDRYGLSPLARRRLQWEIEQAGGTSSDEPKQDESRWLRAVSD